MTEATRWKKLEEGAARDTRSSSTVLSDERKSRWDRHAEKTNAAAIDDARSEMSPAQRMTRRGEEKIAKKKNRFGDPLNTAPVNPSEKFGPVQGKRTAATEWHRKPIQRSNSGRPLDAETLRLKEAAERDRSIRVEAKKREALGIAEEQPHLNEQDIQAFVLFLAAAHTEWPIDERRGPNDGSEADQRYRTAVIHNAHQLRKMWDWIVYKKLAQLDLAGLILSFSECERGGFLDNGQQRKRSFGDELINVVAEPPQSPLSEALGAKSQNAVDEVFALVKSGRARLERQRPANSDEEAEIKRLKAMPFDQLRQAAGSTYKK